MVAIYTQLYCDLTSKILYNFYIEVKAVAPALISFLMILCWESAGSAEGGQPFLPGGICLLLVQPIRQVRLRLAGQKP